MTKYTNNVSSTELMEELNNKREECAPATGLLGNQSEPVSLAIYLRKSVS